MCGRLMCCLRYEHDTYDEALKKLPEPGSLVQTSDGAGIVTEVKPLSEEIRVKLNDNDKDQPKLYRYADIKVLRAKTSKEEPEDK